MRSGLRHLPFPGAVLLPLVLAAVALGADDGSADGAAANPLPDALILVQGKRYPDLQALMRQRLTAITNDTTAGDMRAKVDELARIANDIQLASPFGPAEAQLRDDFRTRILALHDPASDRDLPILDFQAELLGQALSDNGILDPDDRAKRDRDLIAKGRPVLAQINTLAIPGYTWQKFPRTAGSSDPQQDRIAFTNAQQSQVKSMAKILFPILNREFAAAWTGTGDAGREELRRELKDMGFSEETGWKIMADVRF